MKIGIDLGGSHISVGMVNEEGKIVAKQEKDIVFINNEKNKIKEQIRDTIVSLINTTLKDKQIPVFLLEEIGMGIPGTIENNKIKKCDKFEIYNWNIAKELEDYYQVTVKIQNDAYCAALAEKQYGNLKKVNRGIFLCLGTGIGSAIIIKDEVIPSECGHMIIEKEGKECNCMHRGCLETYCSMKILKDSIIKKLQLNKNTTSEEIVTILRNEQQNKQLEELENEFIEYLALGITNIINIINPEKICLGGSFVHFEKTLYHKLISKMSLITCQYEKPEIILAKLKNDAGLIGATLL